MVNRDCDSGIHKKVNDEELLCFFFFPGKQQPRWEPHVARYARMLDEPDERLFPGSVSDEAWPIRYSVAETVNVHKKTPWKMIHQLFQLGKLKFDWAIYIYIYMFIYIDIP